MVKHYLKNGQQVESVAGIVIKQKDFPDLYKTIEEVEKKMLRNAATKAHNKRCGGLKSE